MISTDLHTIVSKLPRVGTTIFTVMSALAAEHKAINLSQGFPDFECSGKLVDLVSHYMKKGFNQYAPMAGILPLREQISEKTQLLYGRFYHPDTEITVTSGATEALFAAITAVTKAGDEVIIFEPAYDSYIPAIELNGAIPVPVALEPGTYRIDWQKVRSKVTEKTRLIIINSPHNPTGTILYKNDLKELLSIVRDTQILVVSDEVYEHIIFDGEVHQSILLHEELAARSFVISSFGKTFHTTGWKIGYCLAPAALTREFRKIHQYLTFSTVTPMQFAIADYLKDRDTYLQLAAFYQQKRDLFRELIKDSRFELLPSNGTYFQLASYRNISDEKDTDFAVRLTREHGVATIPVSVFYSDQRDDKVIRFCFAKTTETLERAGERLRGV